jgi:hypothetical protein
MICSFCDSQELNLISLCVSVETRVYIPHFIAIQNLPAGFARLPPGPAFGRSGFFPAGLLPAQSRYSCFGRARIGRGLSPLRSGPSLGASAGKARRGPPCAGPPPRLSGLCPGRFRHPPGTALCTSAGNARPRARSAGAMLRLSTSSAPPARACRASRKRKCRASSAKRAGAWLPPPKRRSGG